MGLDCRDVVEWELGIFCLSTAPPTLLPAPPEPPALLEIPPYDERELLLELDECELGLLNKLLLDERKLLEDERKLLEERELLWKDECELEL